MPAARRGWTGPVCRRTLSSVIQVDGGQRSGSGTIVRFSVALAALQYLVCSLLSFVGAFALESPAPGPILEAGLPILYAGLASTGIAYTLQIVAQRRAPASHAAIILSLEVITFYFFLRTEWRNIYSFLF